MQTHPILGLEVEKEFGVYSDASEYGWNQEIERNPATIYLIYLVKPKVIRDQRAYYAK